MSDAFNLLSTQIGTIGEDIRQIRVEHRADNAALAKKIDTMMQNGCAKAADHDAIASISERVNVLELARARNLGIVSVVMVAVGVGVTLFGEWIKHKFGLGG